MLVLTLAGCDLVFALERRDAGPDVAVEIDAAPCIDPAAEPHDEDGDGVTDGCDPCPGVADEALTSRDDDAIPDACDPRPDSAGDELVELITFSEADVATRWILEGPQWSISGGALRFSDPGSDFLDATDGNTPFTRPFAVTARFVVETLPATAGQLAVFANANAGDVDKLTCGIKQTTGGTLVFMFRGIDSGEFSEVPTPAPMTVGTPYLVELVYDPATASASCRMRDELGRMALAQITSVPPPPTGPIGAQARSIAGRFEYLAVYRW